MSSAAPGADGLRGQGARFLLFGAANTLLTYALYCALVAFLHPQLAYAGVYVLGIALAYAGNTWFVFRGRASWRTALTYPAVSVATYLANAALLQLLTTRAGLGPRIALAVALLAVTPLSFLLNRALLGQRARAGS